MSDVESPARATEGPAAAAQPPAAPKRDLILAPARMNLAEQWRQDWVVNAEKGTLVDDVMRPSYWAHMAEQMQPLDDVEVRLETGEWVLELKVLAVGRNFAQVYLKHRYDLVDATRPDAPQAQHRVDYLGPQRKHVVIRNSDSAAIKEGFSKKAEAQAWLDSHEAMIAKT